MEFQGEEILAVGYKDDEPYIMLTRRVDAADRFNTSDLAYSRLDDRLYYFPSGGADIAEGLFVDTAEEVWVAPGMAADGWIESRAILPEIPQEFAGMLERADEACCHYCAICKDWRPQSQVVERHLACGHPDEG